MVYGVDGIKPPRGRVWPEAPARVEQEAHDARLLDRLDVRSPALGLADRTEHRGGVALDLREVDDERWRDAAPGIERGGEACGVDRQPRQSTATAGAAPPTRASR